MEMVKLDKITFASDYIDGLVQDCNNSSALALELLQSCTKPLIFLYQIDGLM